MPESHTQSPRKLKPRAAVARAKADLLGKSDPHQAQHPVAELIRDHPTASVGLAAVAGFLIVVAKPGRMLVRQVLMAGTGILLRKALVKYLSK
jgi:hypothetical protein